MGCCGWGVKQAFWDLRKLLVLSIFTLGACTLILLAVSGNVYRGLAYENELRSFQRLIGLKASDILVQLEGAVQEMGRHLQQREVLRNAIKTHDIATLQSTLDGQFRQQITTSGTVRLLHLMALTEDFTPLAQANNAGDATINAALFCSQSFASGRARHGKERLKPITQQLCVVQTRMIMTVLMPVASFHLIGYLALAVDPAPNMRGVELALGAPVQLKQIDGALVYESEAWHGDANGHERLASGHDHLVAHYTLVGSDDRPGLHIAVQSDVTLFNKALSETSVWVSVVAAAIGLPVFLIALYVARNISALIQSRDDEINVRRETERQLVEAKQEAEAANRTKSAFLSNMSHEIRTPLTAVIGFSESMLDADQSMQERIEAIHTINRSGKHLLGIINDILDVSKIEAKKLGTEKIDVALFTLLMDVYNIMHLQAETKHLAFRIDYAFPLPGTIATDPLRLKQVLINLCGNAVKFTEKGGVIVRVRYQREGNRLVFEVHDSGIGISAEQQQRLFNPFTQAESSTARRFGGTGLGLYLSRLLTQALGGELALSSAPGQGSCFTVDVDAGAAAPSSLVRQAPSLAPAAVTSQTPISARYSGRILLAEDNADNRRLITLYVKRLGAELAYAEDGGQAVAQASIEPFDLILMDVQMPVMTGIEATQKLRALGYGGPIVALTANAMRSDEDACLNAGCDAFLSKPIDKQRFAEVVAQYLTPAAVDAPTTAPFAQPFSPRIRTLLT